MSWRSEPSCRKYARESPTWPTSRRLPPATTTAVIVVPMPVSFGSPVARSRTASLARVIASLIGRPFATAARNASMAVHEATSPATMAAHPVGDREQRQPIVDDVRVLVVVANASRVRERAGREFHAALGSQHGVADLQLVALADTRRLRDLLAVQERPVRGAEVLEVELTVPLDDARVHLRRERVRGERDRAAAAAADRRLTVDPLVATALGVGLGDDDPPALAGGARGAGALATARRGRGAAQLAADDPHDAREEQVEQREQAELEDGQDLFRHAPFRTPRSARRWRR